MADPTAPESTFSTGMCGRRRLLGGAATAGVAIPFLAACGGSDDSGGTGDSGDSGDGGAEGGSGTALTSTADVPLGGGVVLGDAEVVVVQTDEGVYTGFTAVCTHQGCIVDRVEDGLIKCGCHGSEFSINDGSVQGGPATAALAEVALDVDGDQITKA